MSLSVFHRMYRERCERPIRDLENAVIKLNRDVESANDRRRKAEFDQRRVENMMGSLFMNREGSYVDDHNDYIYDTKRISWSISLSRHEIRQMVANPDILEKIIEYNLRILMRDFRRGKWCD